MICEDLVTTTITGNEYDPPGTLPFRELQSGQLLKSMTWGDVTDALLGILELKDDWDGMGACRFDRPMVERCFEWARCWREDEYSPPHLVRPTPDGCVCFEWQGENKRIEVEISEDGPAVFEFDA